jgi:hypothetical protein
MLHVPRYFLSSSEGGLVCIQDLLSGYKEVLRTKC